MDAAITKKGRAAALFGAHRQLFRCPVCGKSVKVRAGSRLFCKKEHSFDIAKNGYVNFAGAGGLPGYGAALFAARRALFADGFYAPVAQAVADLAARYTPPAKRVPVLLDAGCGEGYYLASIACDSRFGGWTLLGADLSRDAVAMAARRDTPACWCVADLADLPLQKGSVDVILNLLAPANYAEFKRILLPGGFLVKAVPGADYLREIRAATDLPAPDGDDVVAYTLAHMKEAVQQRVRYTRPLDSMQSDAFWAMTPLATHAQQTRQPMETITIDLILLAGRL